jgi:hypothetical protein
MAERIAGIGRVTVAGDKGYDTRARDCLKAGSPIGILTKDGELYLPISDKMPDYSQRKKLMPFVGKYVQVKGISFERNETHAIIITDNP